LVINKLTNKKSISYLLNKQTELTMEKIQKSNSDKRVKKTELLPEGTRRSVKELKFMQQKY